VSGLLRVTNESRRSVLGGRIRLADSLLARSRGFLLRKCPQAGEGIMLVPCKGVHMFGMRFAIDVVFGDREGIVIATHRELQPGRRTPVHGAAHFALELPSGTVAASRTEVGDRLSWRPEPAPAPGPPGGSPERVNGGTS